MRLPSERAKWAELNGGNGKTSVVCALAATHTHTHTLEVDELSLARARRSPITQRLPPPRLFCKRVARIIELVARLEKKLRNLRAATLDLPVTFKQLFNSTREPQKSGIGTQTNGPHFAFNIHAGAPVRVGGPHKFEGRARAR